MSVIISRDAKPIKICHFWSIVLLDIIYVKPMDSYVHMKVLCGVPLSRKRLGRCGFLTADLMLGFGLIHDTMIRLRDNGSLLFDERLSHPSNFMRRKPDKHSHTIHIRPSDSSLDHELT